jgi:type IV secretion system protein VirB9
MRPLPLVLALALLAAPAAAGVTPKPGPGDPRIRKAFYDPEQVIELTAHLGFQVMIQFAADERIENVSIGDGLNWQLTPNRDADVLFVKPMGKGPTTNMTVVTSRRRYAFNLSTAAASGPRDARLVYVLSFDYPPEPEPAPPLALDPPPPERWNLAYSYEGAPELTPDRLFDDGQSTWFQFAPGEDAPAIYARDPQGAESLVNFTVRGPYVVVDQVRPAFVLRRGKAQTVLHNDAFRAHVPGPLSPRPRPARRGLFSRMSR